MQFRHTVCQPELLSIFQEVYPTDCLRRNPAINQFKTIKLYLMVMVVVIMFAIVMQVKCAIITLVMIVPVLMMVNNGGNDSGNNYVRS